MLTGQNVTCSIFMSFSVWVMDIFLTEWFRIQAGWQEVAKAAVEASANATEVNQSL